MPSHFAVFGPAENGVYSQAFTANDFYFAFKANTNLEEGHNLVKKLEGITSQAQEITPEEVVRQMGNINLSAAKISQDILDVSATAGTKAKLIRGGKLITLLAPSASRLAPDHISGHVKNGDILVLGTDEFFSQLFNVNLIADREGLLAKLESLGEKSGIAAIVVNIEDVSDAQHLVSSVQSPTSNRPVFLRSHVPFRISSAPSKRTLYAAGVILVFLISLLAFQLRSRSLEMKSRTAQTIEKQAHQSLDEANKLAGLNDIMARNVLTAAKNNFQTQTRESFGPDWEKENSAEGKKLRAALAEIDNQLAVVSHIYSLGNLDLFSDFALLRAGANITAATLHNNEIVALDTANGAVYSLGTKSKTVAILGGASDFKNNNYVDAAAETAYIYTSSGIETINRATNSVKVLLPPSDSFVKIRGLKTFAGNLYLLDTDGSQIWKYQGTDLGFIASPSAYLRTGSADLSNVADFAIDGTIFVLSSTGNVANFASGYAQDFSVTGLDKPFNNPSAVFVTDETSNIYILDSGNSRVVVLDKKGNYQSQYVLPATSYELQASLLLADETVKKVFLFSGSKVYSFDLK